MGEIIAITAVSGVVAVMIIISLGITVSIIVKAIRGGGSKKKQGADLEETRLIQEIHHGLTKMEDRVEALETLLLDDERSKRRKFERELENG